MGLPEYVEKRGRGAVAALIRASGLSRPTVERAARGEAISVPAALALSEATGGAVAAAVLAGLANADDAEIPDVADGDAA